MQDKPKSSLLGIELEGEPTFQEVPNNDSFGQNDSQSSYDDDSDNSSAGEDRWGKNKDSIPEYDCVWLVDEQKEE